MAALEERSLLKDKQLEEDKKLIEEMRIQLEELFGPNAYARIQYIKSTDPRESIERDNASPIINDRDKIYKELGNSINDGETMISSDDHDVKLEGFILLNQISKKIARYSITINKYLIQILEQHTGKGGRRRKSRKRRKRRVQNKSFKK
jgi:hypothetical protein